MRDIWNWWVNLNSWYAALFLIGLVAMVIGIGSLIGRRGRHRR